MWFRGRGRGLLQLLSLAKGNVLVLVLLLLVLLLVRILVARPSHRVRVGVVLSLDGRRVRRHRPAHVRGVRAGYGREVPQQHSLVRAGVHGGETRRRRRSQRRVPIPRQRRDPGDPRAEPAGPRARRLPPARVRVRPAALAAQHVQRKLENPRLGPRRLGLFERNQKRGEQRIRGVRVANRRERRGRQPADALLGINQPGKQYGA